MARCSLLVTVRVYHSGKFEYIARGKMQGKILAYCGWVGSWVNDQRQWVDGDLCATSWYVEYGIWNMEKIYSCN